MDELHLKYPFYGSRKLSLELRAAGSHVNLKRVQRPMRLTNIAGFEHFKARLKISTSPKHSTLFRERC